MTDKTPDEVPAGFTDGDIVLEEILTEPGMRKAADLIHEGAAHMDRVYAGSLAEIRKLADEEPEDLFQRLAQSVRHVAVNAYDDESWLILRYEPEHEDHAGSCSCGGECDGDCDGDCDCGHHHPANDD